MLFHEHNTCVEIGCGHPCPFTNTSNLRTSKKIRTPLKHSSLIKQQHNTVTLTVISLYTNQQIVVIKTHRSTIVMIKLHK